MNIKTVSLSLVAIAALAVSGCAGVVPADPAPTAVPTPATTAAKAADTSTKTKKTQAGTPRRPPAKTTSGKPDRLILPNGSSDVYLKKIDTKKRTVTFDLIVFLRDPERMKRWLKDNPGQTNGPDNDYLIQNDNPKLRTMPVTADARIRTLAFSAEKGMFPSRARTLDQLATTFRSDGLPYTLKVKNGKIIAITEIYLP